jgi:acyl-CoA thioesterase-1
MTIFYDKNPSAVFATIMPRKARPRPVPRYPFIPFAMRLLLGSLLAALSLLTPVLAGQADESDQEAKADAETIIIGFGDSLMAGYGLAPGQGFTGQLERRLDQDCDQPVRVINAGVSGDTSTGGRSRLDWALSALDGKTPDLVILELGANDALRGIAPEITRDNLDALITDIKSRGIRVLLAGMLAPPNMGADYQDRFNSLFPALAKEHDVVFYPFFLDGVAADPALNLDDGIHPTAEGIGIMVDRILPFVKKALDRPAPTGA